MKLRLAVGSLLLAGGAYYAICGGEYSLFQVRGIRAEHQLEAARLDSARSDLERLRARADSLDRDPATIERLARERFGLIRPGERLYRFADRNDSTATAHPDPTRATRQPND